MRAEDPATRFAALQQRLGPLFREVYADPGQPRTVVVVPSLSLDTETLAKVHGARHYEERLLSMLMLLRLPRTRLIFLSSVPIAPVVIDYYLHFLSGVPGAHARSRLCLLAAYDASPRPLTQKILERPRLLAQLRAAIGDPASAHLSVFNATELERDLALALDIPLYACDPALQHWGSKSGSRAAFRRAGVRLPDGIENLRSRAELVAALAQLRRRHPQLQRLVVKHDEGFSGEGNALLDLRGAPEDHRLEAWIEEMLPTRLRFEAAGESFDRYMAKFEQLGGIAEVWIEGSGKRSPSVQMRVNPLGELELISTHDQILGGPSGQIFLGSSFPADPAYARDLHLAGERVGAVLRDVGVRGRFAIDFVSVPQPGGGWIHHAIEINIRKGGTTLPYHMLQFLTNGRYEADTGRFQTPLGQTRCYYATDNLTRPSFRRLRPEDLIDILVEHRLHFDETRQTGVVFNLIGALSEFGKLGLVCVADSVPAAHALYEQTVAILEAEAER